MTDRATCWSITINNPTKSDEEWIAQARQKSGWKVYGQLEQGEAGTPHYQLMLTTPQVRFSAVKKAFPRAHIEIARDRKALEKYVAKEDTRVASLNIGQDKYPSHSKLMAWFGEFFDKYGDDNDGVEDHEYLKVFKIMIRAKIREGYFVEQYAVNPQILSLIKNYGRDIAFRERTLRRQTDRQTPGNIVLDIDITNADAERSEKTTQISEESGSEADEIISLDGDT